MAEKFFRYVVLERVAAYEQAGWTVLSHLSLPCAVMEWAGSGEPHEPPVAPRFGAPVRDRYEGEPPPVAED